VIIGITGSFGTGKTTVAKMFARKGAKVLDADKLSHAALKKGTATHKRIVSIFGKQILNKDGRINKKNLAKIVFNNKRKLKRLTAIIHPAVIKDIKSFIKKSSSKRIAIIDAPLLVEARLASIVDILIVVKASYRTQILRCVKKSNLGIDDVKKRIKNQISLKKKIKIADYVINNNGTRKNTAKQVDKIWRRLKWILQN